MKKSRAVWAIVFDVLILLVLGFALTNGYFKFVGDQQWIKDLTFFNLYTNDSAVLTGIAALMSLIMGITVLAGKKPSKFVTVMKLMAAVNETITMVTVLAYLAPKEGWWLVTDYTYNLHVHIVVPVLAILSLLVANKPKMKWPFAFFGVLPTAVYAGVIIPMIANGKATDPYGFLAFDSANPWISVAWYAGFIVAAFIIALILLLLHNIGKEVEAEEAAIEPEQKPEEAKSDEHKPAEEEKKEPEAEDKKDEAKEEEPSSNNAPASTGVVRRAYHITKQPSGKWQVKLANGEKAIRLFDTQAEAIAFTKGLVESRGGSYRIHSVKGKIRK